MRRSRRSQTEIYTDIIIIHLTPEAAALENKLSSRRTNTRHIYAARQGRCVYFIFSSVPLFEPQLLFVNAMQIQKKRRGGCGRRWLYLHVGKLFWFRLKSCYGKSTSDWIGARGFLSICLHCLCPAHTQIRLMPMLITFKLFLSQPAFVFDRAHKRVSLNFNPPALTYCLQDHARLSAIHCVCDCVAKVYVRNASTCMRHMAICTQRHQRVCEAQRETVHLSLFEFHHRADIFLSHQAARVNDKVTRAPLDKTQAAAGI